MSFSFSTRLEEDGLDKDGLKEDGLDKDGLEEDGLDKDGLEEDGLDKDGLEEDGLEKDGLEKDGLEKDGLGEDGLEKDGPGSTKRTLFLILDFNSSNSFEVSSCNNEFTKTSKRLTFSVASNISSEKILLQILVDIELSRNLKRN